MAFPLFLSGTSASKTTLSLSTMASSKQQQQNVVVMRHGDRIDNFEPLWVSTAARPWDPPLVDVGKVRAFCTDRNLRNRVGFGIDRVVISPFLRCVQTAVEVVSALCAERDGDVYDLNRMGSDGLKIDSSNIKISIEYGLCEMMNKEAIRHPVAPKDGILYFNIAEIEAMLPPGTVDHSVERVYKELPQWEETVTEARARYAHIIKTLADKFPTENLLLVTHGEGVGVAVSTYLEDAAVYEVEYCAYAHLQRSITVKDKSFSTGEFEVVNRKGHTGIKYYLPISNIVDDPLAHPNMT